MSELGTEKICDCRTKGPVLALSSGEVICEKCRLPRRQDLSRTVYVGKITISDSVNHPSHYGGESDPYEAIKVIEAWGLGFCLGNTLKYIKRAGVKDKDIVGDLKKAAWYLNHEIERLEKK